MNFAQEKIFSTFNEKVKGQINAKKYPTIFNNQSKHTNSQINELNLGFMIQIIENGKGTK